MLARNVWDRIQIKNTGSGCVVCTVTTAYPSNLPFLISNPKNVKRAV